MRCQTLATVLALAWLSTLVLAGEPIPLARRDDQMGPEQPDTAKGLPHVKPKPFLGNKSMPFSPPFYPSPKTQGHGNWSDAVHKARAYVRKFSTEDQSALVTGSGFGRGRCVADIAPIKKHNFPGLCLMDSPTGVRGADRCTVFPPGITTAATFSKDLFYRRGVAMGEEFRRKGSNAQLGPILNVIRTQAAGRNFESFGADPYPTGEGAFHTTQGVQDRGVQAVLKHYLANEQEHFRNKGSTNLDERTERELYLHPFLRGIQANAVSVMCGYNLINNSWACQNSKLLNDRLKTELKFQGYVMSDWGAQHSGVASALAGLDMAVPGDSMCCIPRSNTGFFWGKNLTEAVHNHTVPAARLEDMATRVLAAWFYLGQDKDFPRANFNFFDINDPATNEYVDATEGHDDIVREVAEAGTVLLKNKHHALPLNKPRKISLIGSDAGPLMHGPNYWSDRIGHPYGTVVEGWGSGTAESSYLISPYEAMQRRARKDQTSVNWSFDDFDQKNAKKVANYTDAAFVFVSSISGEGYGRVPNTTWGNNGDRNNLTLWNSGEELIKSVASVNNNTIVVVHSVGAVLMEDWINHPNVTAVLQAHLPGSQSGNSLASVVWGEYNPSGRLPYTIAKKREDYSAQVLYNSKTAYPQINFTEGLMVDYRWFDHAKIKPRFEFGYGLSYTNFSYSDLKTSWIGDSSHKRHHGSDWNYRWGNHTAPKGLPDWLFKPVYEIKFSLKNTGHRGGHEVPQVYLNFPHWTQEPPRVLRAFDRIWLDKGEQKTVKFELNHYDVSYWDGHHQQWLRPNGTIGVQVGASSRDIRLHKDL